jgi:hypothetical protein
MPLFPFEPPDCDARHLLNQNIENVFGILFSTNFMLEKGLRSKLTPHVKIRLEEVYQIMRSFAI